MKKVQREKLKELDRIRKVMAANDGIVDDSDVSNWLNKYKLKWIDKKADANSIIEKCIYCHAVWSPDMVRLLEASGYCATCRYIAEVIYIACSSCGKIVYAKEIW
jgi:hypothetical protein